MSGAPNDRVQRAPRAVRLLLEIPYRQAGLVALCALVGIAAPLGVARLRPPTQVAGAPASSGDAVRLRLALEPEIAVSRTGPAVQPASPGSALRLDHAHPVDPIDAALRSAPPAAGRVMLVAEPSPIAGWRGLCIGLLLGLLLAALREWPGGRMRTVREAEWALGAPVLGAIPTLSTKARAAGRPARDTTTAP